MIHFSCISTGLGLTYFQAVQLVYKGFSSSLLQPLGGIVPQLKLDDSVNFF